MSLREPIVAAPRPVTAGQHSPDVSVRVLLLLAVSVGLGVIAWQVPASVNPILIGVAAFAVLDRLTARQPGPR